MAIEKLIKEGDEAIKSKDYLGAIQLFSQAIKENPQAFQAFLKRSVAYQKLKNLDQAKGDISTAFTIANDRGRRSDIGLCYFKLALVYYQEKKIKMALSQFKKAQEYDCKESTIEFWKNKCEFDLKNHPEWDVEESDDGDDDVDVFQTQDSDVVEEKKKDLPKIEELSVDEDETKPPKEQRENDAKGSTNVDVINKIAPLNVKIRDDWYQTNEEIIITIYAKNVKEDKLDVHFEQNSVSISFPGATGSEYNYNLDPLYAEIDAAESKYKLYSTKLEITLRKKESGKWPSLEKEQDASTQEEPNATAYPSSSKKKINWNNFKVDDDKDGEQKDFFQTLFKDMDEDSRRAMMKSYVQSNGTVLTTNWEEARNKEFETSPPEGMEAKKWGV
ncbi:SGT1 [Candida margitis]|uniref:SGT1 n=1 Tax=Candida margitis TaxID=1775924 RepID=UPI002226A282|nr:SGT1 [Candida margitis]KAI5957914.1 SGT1 [Candida margitis]